MVRRGMEKRIAGIVRWLERFQRSYRSGALENALMDAECARADLETLRRDVWMALDPSSASNRRRGRLLCRTVASALLVILATASPVSQVRGARPAALSGELLEGGGEPYDSLLAWTSLDREDVGRGLPLRFGSFADEPPMPPADKTTASRRDNPSGAGSESRGRSARRALEPDGPAKKKEIPHEKIFSLLQTGTRALRKEGPVIAVDRGQGKGEGGL